MATFKEGKVSEGVYVSSGGKLSKDPKTFSEGQKTEGVYVTKGGKLIGTTGKANRKTNREYDQYIKELKLQEQKFKAEQERILAEGGGYSTMVDEKGQFTTDPEKGTPAIGQQKYVTTVTTQELPASYNKYKTFPFNVKTVTPTGAIIETITTKPVNKLENYNPATEKYINPAGTNIVMPVRTEQQYDIELAKKRTQGIKLPEYYNYTKINNRDLRREQLKKKSDFNNKNNVPITEKLLIKAGLGFDLSGNVKEDIIYGYNTLIKNAENSKGTIIYRESFGKIIYPIGEKLSYIGETNINTSNKIKSYGKQQSNKFINYPTQIIGSSLKYGAGYSTYFVGETIKDIGSSPYIASGIVYSEFYGARTIAANQLKNTYSSLKNSRVIVRSSKNLGMAANAVEKAPVIGKLISTKAKLYDINYVIKPLGKSINVGTGINVATRISEALLITGASGELVERGARFTRSPEYRSDKNIDVIKTEGILLYTDQNKPFYVPQTPLSGNLGLISDKQLLKEYWKIKLTKQGYSTAEAINIANRLDVERKISGGVGLSSSLQAEVFGEQTGRSLFRRSFVKPVTYKTTRSAIIQSTIRGSAITALAGPAEGVAQVVSQSYSFGLRPTIADIGIYGVGYGALSAGGFGGPVYGLQVGRYAKPNRLTKYSDIGYNTGINILDVGEKPGDIITDISEEATIRSGKKIPSVNLRITTVSKTNVGGTTRSSSYTYFTTPSPTKLNVKQSTTQKTLSYTTSTNLAINNPLSVRNIMKTSYKENIKNQNKISTSLSAFLTSKYNINSNVNERTNVNTKTTTKLNIPLKTDVPVIVPNRTMPIIVPWILQGKKSRAGMRKKIKPSYTKSFYQMVTGIDGGKPLKVKRGGYLGLEAIRTR